MNMIAVCTRNFLLAALLAPLAAAASAKPNIIVIYTDDQGYGDVSALNPESKFQTPNLDRLVNEGIAFTNGHSPDTVCTPSRYGLLTGRYPWRTERKTGVFGADHACMIEDGRVTLASFLRDQGYNTAMVGKWHLGFTFPRNGKEYDWSQPITDMPLDKGFDYFYGIPASMNFGMLAWYEGRYAAVPPIPSDGKTPNMNMVGSGDKPGKKLRKGFMIAPDFIDHECLKRFTEKSIDWMKRQEADAKSGKPFFLYLPYTSPHLPLCPAPEFKGQGEAGAYGELMIETDYRVGQILDYLKASGLDENTLIVFSSDNGPERIWKKHVKKYIHDSRGGLREGKRSVYEGGHRVPFLVRWPQGVQQPGRTWDKGVVQTDLLATFAEILGAEIPSDAGEDSQSFASVLLDAKADYDRVPLISHDSGDERYAITDGSWKLILPGAGKAAELYDLSSDRAEEHNLAAMHPEKVELLSKKLTKLVARGSSVSGKTQPNDTGYWKQLRWMTEEEYNQNSPAN